MNRLRIPPKRKEITCSISTGPETHPRAPRIHPRTILPAHHAAETGSIALVDADVVVPSDPADFTRSSSSSRTIRIRSILFAHETYEVGAAHVPIRVAGFDGVAVFGDPAAAAAAWMSWYGKRWEFALRDLLDLGFWGRRLDDLDHAWDRGFGDYWLAFDGEGLEGIGEIVIDIVVSGYHERVFDSRVGFYCDGVGGVIV